MANLGRLHDGKWGCAEELFVHLQCLFGLCFGRELGEGFWGVLEGGVEGFGDAEEVMELVGNFLWGGGVGVGGGWAEGFGEAGEG